MIELERHIEVLLLDNDCVIVPDFGGFMAHHVDARYDASDNSFVPPIRTLGFNPQLKINDSLLIHSYIEAYELSYPEASQRIEREVKELRSILNEVGYYELNNIGTLTLNTDGNLEFSPNEAGILTPDYYGLSAFTMPCLSQAAEQQVAAAKKVSLQEPIQPATVQKDEEEQPEKHILAIDESDDDDRTISIRVAWIRNAVAIAAAIIAFFIMTTPVSNSVVPQMNMSSMKPSILPDSTKPDSTKLAIAPTDSTITDTVKKEPAPTDADTQATTVRHEAKPAEVKPEAESQSYYVVVLASQVSMTNAENYVKQLHKNGYHEARVHTLRKVNRVVYGKYQSESEAYKAVNRLRDNEEFDEAWVMRVES